MVKDSSIYKLDGGYPDAELKRASFYSSDTKITCYKITYNKKYLTLTHQNILGTLLSLSITKESIGDILPEQGIFFSISEIEAEIRYSFNKISNVNITLEIINPINVKSERRFQDLRFTSESLRLDLVVSKITKLSRKESNNLIEQNLIKVNHLITNKHTKLVSDEDIISIRKFGRFIIKDTHKTNKKGKIIVEYAKYI